MRLPPKHQLPLPKTDVEWQAEALKWHERAELLEQEINEIEALMSRWWCRIYGHHYADSKTCLNCGE